MTDVLYFILAVLYIYGLHNLFVYETDFNGNYKNESSMVLGRFAYYLDKIIPKPFNKPLYACAPCMASVHGLYFYIMSPLSYHPLYVVAWIVALSGALKLINKL